LNNLLTLECGDATAGVMLNAALNDKSVAEYASFGSVNASKVSAAASQMLRTVPSYAVYGARADAPSYEQVRHILK
jgi:hypothetical protein